MGDNFDFVRVVGEPRDYAFKEFVEVKLREAGVELVKVYFYWLVSRLELKN